MKHDNEAFKNQMPTSEEFYADNAPADWANEPEKPQPEPSGHCEDAPTYDEVADNYDADAWHDAHEYPNWWASGEAKVSPPFYATQQTL